jgi:uncharacterized membrane-anchored protein YhcB (DUF1043 family)
MVSWWWMVIAFIAGLRFGQLAEAFGARQWRKKGF